MAIENKAAPVVMPMQPNLGVPDAVQGLMGQPPASPMQMAENGQPPAWQGLPLRNPQGGGQFISPAGPLQVVGPSMYQNAMRVLGIKPGDYKSK